MDAHTRLLHDAFQACVDAARPQRWLPPALEALEPPAGRVVVLALGKAAPAMAEAFAGAWDGPYAGLVVAPRGEGRPVPGFTVLEGAHPVPDATSLRAGQAALAFATGAGPADLLLVLVSGGASAMACAPVAGVSLDRKAEATRRLLASGADISEINAVRRAASRLKGGGLARASRAARVVTLAMSDVPGDVTSDIGSGPAVASPTTAADAVEVLRRYAPDLAERMEGPMRGHEQVAGPIRAEIQASVAFHMEDALDAAESLLRAHGWPVDRLGVLRGEARATGAEHARLCAAPSRNAILSGGELTVDLAAAPGRGGRNQQYLLSLAQALAGRTHVWALAADTDGRDGSAPAAGAWIDPAMLGALDAAEAARALDACDAHEVFRRHDRLVETGATGVNVGDFRLILVGPGSGA